MPDTAGLSALGGIKVRLLLSCPLISATAWYTFRADTNCHKDQIRFGRSDSSKLLVFGGLRCSRCKNIIKVKLLKMRNSFSKFSRDRAP